MFTNTMTSQAIAPSAGFGMSVIVRDRDAFLRALPTTTVADWAAGFDGTAVLEGTGVCAYRHISAVKGAFPGTSAWSPPI